MTPWLPLFAVIGAALGEGGAVVARVAAAGEVSGVDGALAFLAAAGCVLWLGLPVAAVGLGMSRVGSIRSLAGAMRRTLGGGDERHPGHWGMLLLVLALAVGAAAAAGFLGGDPLIGGMSRRFAGLALTLVGASVAGMALVAGAAVAGPAAALARGLVHRLPPGGRLGVGFVATVAVGVGAVGLLRLILPWPYVAMPVGALGGGVLAVALSRRLRGGLRGPLIATGGLWLLASLPPVALPSFPAEVQRAVWYRAPYAGLGLGAARPLLRSFGVGSARGTPVSASGSHAPGRWEPSPAAPSELPDTVPRPQNLVVVQIDALRPDHLGFAGYHRPTSPRMDRFRQGATWWKNAYTPAPSTRFAMTALFTGLDPRRAPHEDLGGNRFRLLPEARTVAEMLAEEGYRRHGLTISYVKHHNRGLGQGFERWETPWHVDAWKQTYGKAAELTSDAALDWLDEQPGDDPFLLFLHYRCTHDPYIKHDAWDFGSSDVDRYDSALAYCDQQIGRVLDRLEGRPDYDETAVVLFSDHGELFGEHGHTSHGNTLHEPDVRVLLLTRIPGVARATVERPVVLTDLAPTFMELAGLEPPADMDGRSMLPLALGEPSDTDPRPLFMFTDLWRGTVHHQASAVLRWPLKLIRDERLDLVQLYDVEADPEERRDLSLRRQEDVASLSSLLNAYDAHVSEAR